MPWYDKLFLAGIVLMTIGFGMSWYGFVAMLRATRWY